jgi:hypothetical protein
MKCIIFLITLCFGVQLSAQNQDADIQSKIDFFNSKIQQTDKGERLTWLDSLTKITYLNPKLEYDVVLR